MWAKNPASLELERKSVQRKGEFMKVFKFRPFRESGTAVCEIPKGEMSMNVTVTVSAIRQNA
jgi:hypothetical protein